ncbi:MAG: hypothetical protein ABEH58_06210 [Haloplanus sp.]
MPRPSDTFETVLDGLDPAERAAFVAAVYAARGWGSERTDTVVFVRPPGGAGDGRRLVPPGVEAPDDAAKLDPAELRESVRYAVTSDERTRLCRQFFDRPPDAVGLAATAPETRPTAGDAPGDDRSGSDASPVDDGVRPDATHRTERNDAGAAPASETVTDDDGAAAGGRRTLAASRPLLAAGVVLACAIAVVLFVAPPGVIVGDSGPDGPTPALSTPNASDTPVAATTTPADERGTAPVPSNESVEDSASGRLAVLERSYPPGVGVDGVENASALTAAHAAALSGRSYRLSVVVREFAGGRPTAVAWERTLVAGPARYRSRVRVAGTFRRPPDAVAPTSTYADGTTRVVRVGSDTAPDGRIRFADSPAGNGSDTRGHRITGPAPDADSFASRTASLLRGTLAQTETNVTGSFEDDGTTHFWVAVKSVSPVANVDRGTLLIDERGVVREVRYTRTAVATDATTVRQTVVIRITPGEVTVTPPPWYRPGDTGQ